MPQYRFNPPPNWPPPPTPNFRPRHEWVPPAEWGPLPDGWQLWVPVEPPTSHKMPTLVPKPKTMWTHPLMIVTYVVMGIVLIASLGVAAGSTPSEPAAGSTPTAEATSQEPSEEPTTEEPTEEPTTEEPTVEPSADGTTTGMCDYELAPYRVNAEVEVENTGNIGAVVKVRTTWPQFGHAPLKATKKVKVRVGQTKIVQFSKQVSVNEILSLQSWQERNGYADGCKYRGTILRTFGEAR